MPNLDLIPVTPYQPEEPYHHVADNRPILELVEQIEAVNAAVENATLILTSAIGDQGTLANRLAQSLNDDGTLKTTAIDNALHSIAEHLDTDSFVRMTIDERAKLSLIAPESTDLKIEVSTISGALLFDTGTLRLAGSDSITWNFLDGEVFAETDFPSSVRHQHYYGLTPVHQDTLDPNYTDYYTTSLATSYREDSLRVYVNGVRLDPNANVYVPVGMPSTVTYLALSYDEDSATSGVVTSGGFSLTAAIPSTANIMIDFDRLYS